MLTLQWITFGCESSTSTCLNSNDRTKARSQWVEQAEVPATVRSSHSPHLAGSNAHALQLKGARLGLQAVCDSAVSTRGAPEQEWAWAEWAARNLGG